VLQAGLQHIHCHENPERPAEVNDLTGASVKGFNHYRRRPVNDGQSALLPEMACIHPRRLIMRSRILPGLRGSGDCRTTVNICSMEVLA
jgi:hypothetical protein